MQLQTSLASYKTHNCSSPATKKPSGSKKPYSHTKFGCQTCKFVRPNLTACIPSLSNQLETTFLEQTDVAKFAVMRIGQYARTAPRLDASVREAE